MARARTKKPSTKLKIPSLAKTRASFNSGLASEIALPSEDQLWLPSRSLMLTYTLGGGIPFGRMVEIFGVESSGKTLIAQDFGYIAQKAGGIVLWDDAEQSFTPYWAEQNGLDMAKIELCNEMAVEKVSDWLLDMVLYYRSKLLKNEPILFIQDSLAALDCQANINSKQADAKAEMGNRAKAVYKMMRIRNKLLTECGVISIFINQLRQKVGATNYEDPDVTPAGNAMKFYAAQRIGVYGGKQIKDKVNGVEERVGAETSIRLKKNKVAPPRPTFKTNIFFHPEYNRPLGLDRYSGLAEILTKTGVLTKKPRAPYYFEDKVIAKGEEALDELLRKDIAIRKKLISASGINTLSKLKGQLSGLNKNLYPIKDLDYERQAEE